MEYCDICGEQVEDCICSAPREQEESEDALG